MACALMAALVATAMAGTFVGYISESGCGAKHVTGSDKDVNCVKGCVKKGAKPVFVTEDNKKVYQISDASKVMDHLGKKVQVTGELEGDTLKVDSVQAAH